MADDADIQVTVTARTDGLTAPMQQASNAAKAAFDGMRISAADFAKALDAAGGDMRKVSAEALGVAGAAKAAAAGMTEAAAATTAAGAASTAAASTMAAAETAATGLGHGAAGVTRELIVLGGEAVRGNFSRIPGSLLVLTNRMNLLSLSTLGPAAAVAVLTAALGVMIYRSAEAENTLERLNVAFAFQGIDASKKQIESLIETVHRLPGATLQDAEAVIRGFAQMKDASLPLITALVNAVGEYAASTGKSAKEAGESLARSFEDPIRNGERFIQTLHNVSDAILQEYETARRAGDAGGAVSAMLKAQNEAFRATIPALAEQQSAWSYSLKNAAAYFGAVRAGIPVEQVHADIVKQRTAALLAQADAQDKASAAAAKVTPKPADTLNAGLEAGQRENPKRVEIDETMGDIAQINRALEVAKATGNQVRVAQLNQDLSVAKEKLDSLQNGPSGGRQQAALDAILVKVAANARTTQELERNTAAATAQFWAQAAAQVVGTDAKANEERTADLAKANRARLQLAAETLRAETSASKQSLEEQIASLSAQQAEAAGDYTLIASLEQRKLALIRNALGERSKAYQDELKHEAELENQHQQEILRLGEEGIKREEQADQESLEAKRKSLDTEVAQRTITKAQEIVQLQAFADAEHKTELQSLNDLIASLNQGTAAYKAALAEREAALHKFAAEDQAYQAEAATAAAQAAQKQAAAFEKNFGQIGAAWNSAVAGLVKGTETWRQAEAKVADSIADSFIQAAESMAAKWLAEIAAMAIGDSALSASVTTAQAAGGSGFSAIGGWILKGLGSLIPGFAVGAWELPGDQLAMVHAGEMIVPSGPADTLRAMASNATNSDGGFPSGFAPGASFTPAGFDGGEFGGVAGDVTTIGDVSHNASFSQTNHFYGSGDSGQIHSALKSSNQDLNSNFQHWYGNTGTPNLPGRRVHT